MANMTPKPNPDPQKKEKAFSFKLDAPTVSDTDKTLRTANFSQMEGDASIKMIITVKADGTITSYNHPLTGVTDKTEEKLKDESGEEPYDVKQIWDLATLTLIIYGEATPAGQPLKAEIGYWKTVGGTRIMIS